MYDEQLVKPMREELTKHGFVELRTDAQVNETLSGKGTTLVVVNSVCGCAAGAFRPGVTLSLCAPKVPEKLTTVFAGQDKEATAKARSYFTGYPPSSPSAALLKDGEIVFMLERKDIEGHSPTEIASALKNAYEKHC